MNVRYKYRHDHQSIEVTLMAGMIYGNAPLFERFVLGDSTTLRGWNKYDLDPLGGNRVVHGSVTYGYHIMRVFYDTGCSLGPGEVAGGQTLGRYWDIERPGAFPERRFFTGGGLSRSGRAAPIRCL